MPVGSIGGVSVSIGISFSFGLGVSLSLPLAITVSSMASKTNSSSGMASSNHMAVMSNNSGAGLNPLAHLMALLSHDILAVLDIGGVHDSVILLVTHLPGHLSGVLNRPLLTLPFSPGLALGSTGVAMRGMPIGRISLSISFGLRLSVSLSLAITMASITSRDELAVVTDHTRAVMDPLVDLVALLSHDVLKRKSLVKTTSFLAQSHLAVFNVGGVDDGLVGLMAFLVTVAWHTSGHCSKAGKGDKELHTELLREPSHLKIIWVIF